MTNWEFVLAANGTPKVLGSGAYGTVSDSIVITLISGVERRGAWKGLYMPPPPTYSANASK